MLSTVYCLSLITLHSALCTSSFLAFGRAASYHSSLKLFSDIQAGEGLRSLRGLGRGLTAALLGVVCLAAGCRQVKESTGVRVGPKGRRGGGAGGRADPPRTSAQGGAGRAARNHHGGVRDRAQARRAHPPRPRPDGAARA